MSAPPPPLSRVTCVLGDLVEQDVDVLVNAANAQLAGGGGVDGAIHRAAGPELLAYLRRHFPDGCPTGDAVLTPGFGLRAPWVIHAVGPVWRRGREGEAEALASCHRRAVELAQAHGLARMAFAALSCGVYGYPHAQAAEVAMGALDEALGRCDVVREVRMVLFGEGLLEVFRAAHARALGRG